MYDGSSRSAALEARAPKCLNNGHEGRESGMPDEKQWAEFSDAERVIGMPGCIERPGEVVEFGCR
jgi:hypothetical protein